MNARAYAHALARLSDSAPAEKVVASLVNVLTRTGRLKLLPRILRELKAEEGKKLATAALVEVAKKSDAPAALKAAKAEGIEADEAIVNESIIAGWRARGEGKLVDRSGKKNLIDLYQRIVG